VRSGTTSNDWRSRRANEAGFAHVPKPSSIEQLRSVIARAP